MAHSVSEILGENRNSVEAVNNTASNASNQNTTNQTRKAVGVVGSRRIFPPSFKLQVLESYRNDNDCRGNQRATARKYNIHRRQIQKWLQCEESLRSSSAESNSNNGGNANHNHNHRNNNSGATTSNIVNSAANIINTTTIVQTAEPTVVTTSPVMTPATVPATAAPTLNLSLARLHGDELPGRQQPPPPHPTSHQGGCSPTYTSSGTNPLPIHAFLMGYSDYSGKELHHHHPQHQLFHHPQKDVAAMHRYPIEHAGLTNESKLFALNHPAYEQSASSGYHNGNDVKLYHQAQTQQHHQSELDPYQNNHGYKGIIGNIRDNQIIRSTMHHSPPYVPPSTVAYVLTPLSSVSPHSSSASSHSYGRDAESPGNEALVPAIKSERTSPDSLATPVACSEPPSSFGVTATTSCSRIVNPASQHINVSASGIVPYEHTLQTTGLAPCLDVSVNLHTVSVSVKREPMYFGGENYGEMRIKNEVQGICGPAACATSDRWEGQGAIGERRASHYDNVLSMSGNNSQVNSRTTSPAHVSRYSPASSPREAANSSSRSTTSSWSDSEIDSLDYSSSRPNPASDSSRRRSFSLRFKLDVLDAFHHDDAIAGNQRATARKFGINRRQVQKWLGQETELRGEIKLRGGDSRQRLGPVQEPPEVAVDLRKGSSERSIDLGASSPSYYGDLPYQINSNYATAQREIEVLQRTGKLPCSTDNQTTSSIPSGYPGTPRSSYTDSQSSRSSDSPRDLRDSSLSDTSRVTLPPRKRSARTPACSSHTHPKKRKFRGTPEHGVRSSNNKEDNQDQLTQEAPLCLVKNKASSEASTPQRTERSARAVPTPPTPPSNNDAILFKPYLDNPVVRPTIEIAQEQREQSPRNNHRSVIVNNINPISVRNLNEERNHDYSVELSLRLPTSWNTPSHVIEFPESIRSAFARYQATPHYI
uniref:Brinker DNA-binding domain-containing protein n=1 Tax=Bracon brevicornis TaxID=1563983 RepID=A0A6V7JXN8_9HYME